MSKPQTTKPKLYWAAKLNGFIFPWSCATDRVTSRLHAIDGLDSADLRDVRYVRVKITEVRKKK